MRIIFGARVSLLIALAVVFFSGIVGVVLGLVSGYFRRWVDSGIQKLPEVFWALPLSSKLIEFRSKEMAGAAGTAAKKEVSPHLSHPLAAHIGKSNCRPSVPCVSFRLALSAADNRHWTADRT
ncbi:hypothetical protein [Roseicitreum antarcticum]|uniref:hypothetical protein n=1 Tax=Roseicitreum antarcticum TaxID=564137 RepID=UPI000AD2A36F|nr:hypothetical protein [Roseicitreum antarcticum]